MSIHKIGSDLVRPPVPKGTSGSGKCDSNEADKPRRHTRADSIDISDHGRELSAYLLGDGPEQADGSLQEVHDRIREGFYDRPSVAGEVARRLLSSGDLDVI